MMGHYAGAVLALAVFSAQESVEQLRSRMASENDLIRKARYAVRAAELQLEAGRKKYKDGYPEDGQKLVEDLLALVEQAYDWLGDTGRDPRKRPAGFKDTEIKLRKMVKALEELRLSMPADERPPLEKVQKRLREIGEDLLLGVMRVKKKEGL
jgi:hypothetical protein